jgi:hypothetical protein
MLQQEEAKLNNKNGVNAKILDRISQHESSYIMEGLKKLDEFDFRVSVEIDF